MKRSPLGPEYEVGYQFRPLTGLSYEIPEAGDILL